MNWISESISDLRLYGQRVFPAGAGVILDFAISLNTLDGFPRRCGGDPIELYAELPADEFSPQVRG